ncbi:MAG: SufE family protein [bacterium]
MNTNPQQQEIINEFKDLASWEDKYEKIIMLGKSLPELPSKYKKEENKVSGCTSRVWLVAEQKDGKLFFESDSDSMMVKGLVSLLLKLYSGKTFDQIIQIQADFIDQIGLKGHLSPTRNNGLLAVLKQIKAYAVAYSHKANLGR